MVEQQTTTGWYGWVLCLPRDHPAGWYGWVLCLLRDHPAGWYGWVLWLLKLLSRLIWMGFVLAERLLLHTLFVLNVIEGWTWRNIGDSVRWNAGGLCAQCEESYWYVMSLFRFNTTTAAAAIVAVIHVVHTVSSELNIKFQWKWLITSAVFLHVDRQSRPCNGFAVLRRVRNCRVWLIDWLTYRTNVDCHVSWSYRQRHRQPWLIG